MREFAHTKQEGKSPEMVGETGPKALDNRLAFIMLITPHGDIHWVYCVLDTENKGDKRQSSWLHRTHIWRGNRTGK